MNANELKNAIKIAVIAHRKEYSLEYSEKRHKLENELQKYKERLLEVQSELQECMSFDRRIRNFTFFTVWERMQISQVRASLFDQYNYINNLIESEQVRHPVLSEKTIFKIKKIIPDYDYL